MSKRDFRLRLFYTPIKKLGEVVQSLHSSLDFPVRTARICQGYGGSLAALQSKFTIDKDREDVEPIQKNIRLAENIL